MDTLGFEIVLFVAYFLFLSWLFVIPQAATANSVNTTEDLSKENLNTAELEKEKVSTDKLVNKEVKEKETLSFEAFLEANGYKRLTLRPGRKIAKQLQIKQKVGSKDQPAAWLVAQIKKRYEQDPDRVGSIILQALKQEKTKRRKKVA